MKTKMGITDMTDKQFDVLMKVLLAVTLLFLTTWVPDGYL